MISHGNVRNRTKNRLVTFDGPDRRFSDFLSTQARIGIIREIGCPGDSTSAAVPP